MKKVFLLIVSFLVGVIIFMPKENLLYTLGKELKKDNIEIVSDEIRDRLIDLDMKNVLLIYDGIEALRIKEIDIKPWMLYNKIEAFDIAPSKSLSNMLNIKAKHLTIIQSIIDMKKAHISGDGDFGVIEGEIDLGKRVIKIILHPKSSFKNSQLLRDYFKKGKEGYIYESKF
jgi:hypothetical protein